MSWLSELLSLYHSACAQVTLILLAMDPKHKSSDAGNSGMPKRSPKVVPLSEKVKVLQLIRKIYMLRLLGSIKYKSSVCEIG